MKQFDAIYVINLPSRKDRRRQMNAQFKRIGVDPSSRQVIFFDAVRPDDAGGFPSIGTRGCFLSHLGVLRAAIATGQRRILILEDDVNFNRDFNERLAALTPEMATRRWGLAYFGALSVTPPPPPTTGLSSLAPESGVMGSHMLAVDASAMQTVTAYLEGILGRAPGDPRGGPMHVDGAYSRFRADHPEIETLLVTPALGYQRASRTDIHDLKWFDRVPVIDKLVAGLRYLRAGAMRQS